jgi:hypothetical protein
LAHKKIKYQSQDYIFVLWGDQFDSLAASIFVTQLRKAGLRVKLVSLARQTITGTQGLTLLPDLTLEQALPLAKKAIGVIIPCGPLGAKQLENDPRLDGFFKNAHANNARFVIGDSCNVADTKLFPPAISDKITIYPGHEDLLGFAHQLAISFSSVGYQTTAHF